ncbi:MAG: hypothetical protein IT365_28770 [Candidatus Hydrogenedentes bacterium]|nr:hypothetical protein [Candidatus Hydrogenedentota bacterium]
MKRCFQWSLVGVMLVAGAYAGAQDAASAAAKVGSLPAGVSSVKANPDGTFKSLVVKATVEVDPDAGKARASKAARDEARTQCIAELSQWIKQNCEVLVTPEGTPTLVTKGEGGKDAAGAPVQLKKPAGKELTAATGDLERVVSLLSRRLVSLHSESVGAGNQRTVVMGLSQEQLNSPEVLKSAEAEDENRYDRRERLLAEGPPRSLEDDAPRNPAAVKGTAQVTQPAAAKGSKNLADYL